MRRVLLSSLIIIACCLTSAAQTLTADSARVLLSRLPLHDIEGIWQLTTDGAEVMICRSKPGDTSVAVTQYDMVLISAPDRSRRPGTVLGHLSPTARPATFDARVFTDIDSKGLPTRTKRFTMKLEDSGHLTFTRVNKGIKISPLALFPYLFRRAVKITDDRQRDLDGAIKRYPEVPIKGIPRYL